MQAIERYVTAEQYLELEARSPERAEYVAGEIYVMTGAFRRHNVIAGNAYMALRQQMRGSLCQVFMGDVKLRVERSDAYYYPEVMVVCDQAAPAADARLLTEDARLVVEVLSPSTEATDRREKLAAYRRLPGLQEYALVSQDQQQVEVYRRQGDIG